MDGARPATPVRHTLGKRLKSESQTKDIIIDAAPPRGVNAGDCVLVGSWLATGSQAIIRLGDAYGERKWGDAGNLSEAQPQPRESGLGHGRPKGSGVSRSRGPSVGQPTLPPKQSAGLAAEGREGQGTWQLNFVFGLKSPVKRIRVQGAPWEGKFPVKVELRAPRLVTLTSGRGWPGALPRESEAPGWRGVPGHLGRSREGGSGSRVHLLLVSSEATLPKARVFRE